LGGLAGGGIGYKSPEIAEGVANRVVGEENVPMWMKSPQSVGRMVEGAQDEMYNEKGDALINRGKAQAKLDAPPKLGKSTILQIAAPEREAAIPRADAPTPAEEFAGRQAQARIAPPEPEEGGIATPYGRGGESQIGSNAPERQVQTIMQKNIVTPDEQSFVERSLGPNARMRPGEGITDWRARVTGLMKAARARTK
jgi:hypothetical protein